MLLQIIIKGINRRFAQLVILLTVGLHFSSSHSTEAATIQIINFSGYRNLQFNPNGGGITLTHFSIASGVSSYNLSDSTSWQSGAGSFRNSLTTFESSSLLGNQITYHFVPLVNERLFGASDFNAGMHSTNYDFGWVGPLSITATQGSTEAFFSGYSELLQNTSNGNPNFDFLDANVGDLVPFFFKYTITSGTWQPDTFESIFDYVVEGTIQPIDSIPEPSSAHVVILGSVILVLHRHRRSRASSLSTI